MRGFHAISSFYGSLCERNTLMKKIRANVFVDAWIIALMYIKKSDGPRIEPSGTPHLFSFYKKSNNCVLSEKSKSSTKANSRIPL